MSQTGGWGCSFIESRNYREAVRSLGAPDAEKPLRIADLSRLFF